MYACVRCEARAKSRERRVLIPQNCVAPPPFCGTTFSPPLLHRSELLVFSLSPVSSTESPRPERPTFSSPSAASSTVIVNSLSLGTTAAKQGRNGRLLRSFPRRHHPGQAEPGSRQGEGPRPRARHQGKERRPVQESTGHDSRRRYLLPTSWWLSNVVVFVRLLHFHVSLWWRVALCSCQPFYVAWWTSLSKSSCLYV